ncbi:DUF1997 domain-containing protein [Desertifilum sp. FACHB-1129]|uniref:DUF1997 domain-containing protein n=2 Tax=Desertifilum tharense IPPAS B-1220 TaxID=1781255 RepID=A0A1E5QQV5_9CYAN|nr:MULTISPECIES: DUF1997 domain-containing protein [Desertifilum]MCD8485353.1 DUF1997 domain-containing protein [Desertifilum sp.]MDA0210798.1 DUF1997 domain-containing protein [Cyanobacteria bacterium FC1]MBD2312284.1 DUF1997 domain-containing protein [Desertifilum sp. FACHB-1129]MBD2323649.1 DUF1997 domain-containing protein [Desertifilum sp. FACHB-866]MBD2332346.1 DUF1997 domain-containing protein [Desertifilum sp. FACHB-868]
MQLPNREHQLFESSEVILGATPTFAVYEEVKIEEPATVEPTQFYTRYEDFMEMNASPEQVAAYLDVHEEWFTRCAHPMKVEPLGKNGYALVIGKFGSFGYEVEPKVGLELKPQDEGVYRIETREIPDYVAPGYEVDFKAAMELLELPGTAQAMTRVQWQLDLTVSLRFPKFIHALPQSLIQKTGDRLLAQIVRQVSRRLTHKVQTDFHASRNLALPKMKR